MSGLLISPPVTRLNLLKILYAIKQHLALKTSSAFSKLSSTYDLSMQASYNFSISNYFTYLLILPPELSA